MEKPAYWKPPHQKIPEIFTKAKECRKTLTPREYVFWKEAHTRWPKFHWRRYGAVTIKVGESLSTWYAPFLCIAKKLIVVIEDRPNFPYRIYGENRALYERHGYTVLDFSEDFFCPTDESVWEEAMAMIDQVLHQKAAS